MTRSNFIAIQKPQRHFSQDALQLQALNDEKQINKTKRKQAVKHAQVENDFHNSFIGAEYV